MKFNLLTVALALFCINAFSQTVLTVDDVTFNKVTRTITAYNNTTAKDIIIPTSFNVEGTDVNIEYISSSAFTGKELTSVAFSDSSKIKKIAAKAFADNVALSNITLPSNSNPGFTKYQNTNLESFVDGDEITDFNVEYYVPYTLTANDVTISSNEISKCTYNYNLKDIIIPDTLNGQAVHSIYKGYSNSSVFGGKGITSVQLPNTLIRIGEYSFCNNKLTKVTIPKSVKYIKQNSFTENNIDTVIFESNSDIRQIEINAFRDNRTLKPIVLPTHSNENFVEYRTNKLTVFNEGDAISDLTNSYYAYIPYTLTDDDVVVTNGELISCSYNPDYTDIIFPDTLDGQAIKVIPGSLRLSYSNRVTTIEFPKSLESISTVRFSNKELYYIKLYDKLTNIGSEVFKGTNLTFVNIPDNVTTIGDRAFLDVQLDSLVLSKNLKSIGSYAFYNNSSLSSLVIHDSVTFIGEWAFRNNSNLSSITLPNNATVIGESAFLSNKCDSLIIPNKIIDIGNSAFASGSIKKVTFESGSQIRNIGSYAFSQSALPIVLPTHGSVSFTEYRNSNNDVLAEGDSITDPTLNYFSVLTYKLTNNDVEVIDGVIVKCNYDFSLTDIIIPEVLDGQTIVGIADYYSSNGVFAEKGITSVKLPQSLSSIGDYAFYKNKIKAIDLTNIKNIGIGAFSQNELSVISIPDSITEISKSSFSYNNIVSLTLPNSVKTIGDNAFYDNSLTSIDLPDSLTSIGSSSFLGNNLNGSIEIPNSVSNIGNGAFMNNSITSITIPDSLETIEDRAFASNDIMKLIIPAKIKSIGHYAFYANNLNSVIFEPNSNINYIGVAFSHNNIDSIILPTHTADLSHYFDINSNIYYEGDNITDFSINYFVQTAPYTLTNSDVEVVNGCITKCTYDFKIKNIIIPDTLDGQPITSINSATPADIFYKKGIIAVKLPSTIKTIGNSSFYGNKITAINIPQSVTYIGSAAFSNNSIKSLNFEPNSQIAYILQSAFNRNVIDSINIPSSIVALERDAFAYNELKKVTFSENSNIQLIDKYAFYQNDDLESITLPTHANSDFTNYTSGWNKVYNENDDITDFYTSYTVKLPPYKLTSSDVTVVNGVIVEYNPINYYLSIIIPSTIDGEQITAIKDTSANSGIFSNLCLLSAQLSDGLISIGNNAFSDNKLMGVQTIPASVKSIGEKAFYDNWPLTTVVFNEHSQLEIINASAFNDCSLDSISLPNGIKQIKKGAFSENNFSKLIIPNSVTHIGDAAFSYNSIDSLIFKENSNIEYIGKQAFSQNNINKIALPTHVNSSFLNYSDGYSNTYAPGDSVSDLIISYSSNFVLSTVTFTITNGNDAIEGAKLTFNEQEYTSDANGMVYIENVIAKSYNYSVSMEGYIEVNDQVVVDDIAYEKTIVLVRSTSVESNAANNKIKVYPNPATDILNIEGLPNNKTSVIKLYSSIGEIKITVEVNQPETTLDISNLPSGIYILRVNNSTKKITIE